MSETIRFAASIIREGGVVAFPTETYYGLAVNPFNEEALRQLFELKRRPSSKPILTLINQPSQLSLLVQSIPALYRPLMEQFWPGALTLIFPALGTMSAILTGGTQTIGVRISSNPLARTLGEVAGLPITATSANLSGEEPASSADEVRNQFGDKLDLIIDGGRTPGGPGSTIVGIKDERLQLIRAGALAESCLGL